MKLLEKFKYFLKSNTLGRKIYTPLNKVYRLYSEPKRQRLLQSIGYEVLEEVVRVSDAEKLNIFPVCGTLLGFVRDKGFIPWDDDMDFAIIDKEHNIYNLVDILVNKYGFEFIRGFAYNQEVTEVTLSLKGLQMDFFRLTPYNDRLALCSCRWNSKISYASPRHNNIDCHLHPHVDSYTRIEVNGISVPVPTNYAEFLRIEYGDWRTPNRHFDNQKGLEAKFEMHGFAYILTYQQFLDRDFGQ